MMTQFDKKTMLALGLVALVATAAMTRIVPHSWNFTPITAIALFSGAYFAKRWMAVAATLGVMLISDTMLAVQHGFSYGFHTLLPLIYLSYAAVVFIGGSIKKKNVLNISLATLAGSVLFFIVSNLGVWAMGGYGYSLEGFIRCYEMAIPFFRTGFAGDAVYTAVLFGSYAFAERLLPSAEKRMA